MLYLGTTLPKNFMVPYSKIALQAIALAIAIALALAIAPYQRTKHP